jgi:two-component sensor histidine kinase
VIKPLIGQGVGEGLSEYVWSGCVDPIVLFDGSCDERSAGVVRREVRALQANLAIQSRIVEDLELAATELVTNAVKNGAHYLDVRLVVVPPDLELRVTDDGPGAPTLRTTGRSDTSGRGLQIIASVATHWGWSPYGTSKTVWARFGG